MVPLYSQFFEPVYMLGCEDFDMFQSLIPNKMSKVDKLFIFQRQIRREPWGPGKLWFYHRFLLKITKVGKSSEF